MHGQESLSLLGEWHKRVLAETLVAASKASETRGEEQERCSTIKST
jgi:hypothetical protein